MKHETVFAAALFALLLLVASGCSKSIREELAERDAGSEQREPAIHTVIYNANEATGGTAPSAQTKNRGVDLTLAANSGKLVRTGYAFAGWNTQSDGSGVTYAEGANYATNAHLTLYAYWTQLATCVGHNLRLTR